MKTQNLIKRTTALLMSVSFASQLAFAGTPSQVTPEKILLKNVIALSGEGLSADQAQEQTVAVISNYEKTASQAGQLERLRDATVELGLYTPDQAQAFVENIHGSLQPVVEAGYASAQDRNQALATALSQIEAPKGAQFSACAADLIVAGVAIVGGPFTVATFAGGDANLMMMTVAISLLVGGIFAAAGCSG